MSSNRTSGNATNGRFCTLSAICDEHAQLQLEALKTTGELNGPVIGCDPDHGSEG